MCNIVDENLAKKRHGEALVAERERLGLSIQRVSDALGIHRNSLYAYEQGHQEHGVLLLQGLKALGFDLVGLLGIDVDNRPPPSQIQLKFAAAPPKVQKAIITLLDHWQ